MASKPAAPIHTPTPIEFAHQLLSQLYADLDHILSQADSEEPVADAYGAITAAVDRGEPRAASLYVMAQAAIAAYTALLGSGEDSGQGSTAAPPALDLPDHETTAAVVLALCPGSAGQLSAVARHGQRLSRYAAEAEPAAPRALPAAIAIAIVQLYQGMLNADSGLGTRGLVSLRTLLAHCDAMATQLDPAEGNDRPIRVFPPDRFHDHFLFLTEKVQQTPAESKDRPVAALTRDGRLTALITSEGHPLEEAAQAVRDRVPGDPTTKEHALLRMQGLLRMLEDARHDPTHPFAAALDDDRQHLALVTAAATCPMIAPGRFGLPQLAQIFRYNRRLLGGAPPQADASP